MRPEDPIEKHFTRLKPEQKRALKRLGIHTIRDLLYHFPSRYERSGPTAHSGVLTPGAEVTLYGTIRKPEIRKAWRSRRPIAEAYLDDASGKIKLIWFSQPYIAKTLAEGMQVKITGRVAGTADKPYVANPIVDRTPIAPESAHDSLFAPGEASEVELFPVYPESEGISSLWLYYALKKIFAARAHELLADPLPEDIRARYHLPSLATSLHAIHLPQEERAAQGAKKRFAFEEVFALAVANQLARAERAREHALKVAVERAALQDFVESFPFPATGAQARAIESVVHDFERPEPMRRLLEGDVGSGKTAVAAATSYVVATSRPPDRAAGTLQVAYMCPTEILAKQHFSTFISYFKDHPIPIALITGSECRKFPSKVRAEESTKISKTQLRKWVAEGTIPIVIGTHALIQDSLEFKYLAYVIIDEQHRFGTLHRKRLVAKGGTTPHLLSMTATPIPRTLALTIYGDLDLSLLDELPPGRKRVITQVVGPKEREAAYARVRTELTAGRQAYVICPRIDEPDPKKQFAIQAKSVTAEAARLKKEVFKDATIGILHSKMTPSEKERAMRAFEEGATQILVATSVVEVGVNVPNATVILIEGAERFGLAQLHQLRGRVIRSSQQAYCFLLPETLGTSTRDRLKALTTAKDGFELAEYDLALRGAGELAGGSQWGVSDIAMEALKNIKLVEAAKNEAAALVAKDSTLAHHQPLRARVESAERQMHLE